MNEKEIEKYKKEYQEMVSNYSSGEILESIFIAIRRLDKIIAFQINNEIIVALETIASLYERIDKLEKAISSLLESEN